MNAREPLRSRLSSPVHRFAGTIAAGLILSAAAAFAEPHPNANLDRELSAAAASAQPAGAPAGGGRSATPGATAGPAATPAAPAGPGPGAPPAAPAARGFFPYPITRETLPNGLTLLVVPFDSPGVASLYTLVRAGSRNEVEPGRSGFAHFFEHMMFRGTQKWPEGARRALLAETGSDDNGWTTDDYTCYALTTQSARLEEMIAEEADRIRNLRYSEAAFRTESRAVLGEYNKNIADPEEKLVETLRATAFTTHTYRHTTMGFVEDIRAMPEGYEYSRSFFDRYYVPAEVVLIAAGDVHPAGVTALVRKHYGSWKKAGTGPRISPEPAQTAERRATVAWEAPTLPRLAIAWHAPAATDLRAAAALRLLVPSLFGPTSDLYRDLVLDRRLAVALTAQYALTRDPGLFTVTVRATKAEDLPVIERSVTTVLEGLGAASFPGDALERARQRIRSEFLLSLQSAPRIAGTLASWTSLTGDPGVIDGYFAAVASLGAEEVVSVARSVFRKENRTVVTLVSTAAAPPPAPPAEPCAAAPDPVLMPAPAEPSVAVRVAFRAGSVDDPPGLEGITALTARAMAEGATESHSLQELNTLLEPTAASLRVDVDKEVTTFSGRVSREQAGLFVSLLMERLLEPRFESPDVERIRRAALDDIRSRLRNNDDESLGKEALSLLLYEGHPYGHYTGGSIAGLERITAEDMRAHRARVFTADRVTIGLAGGYPGELERKLAGLPAALPCPPSSTSVTAPPTPNGSPEAASAPSPDRPAPAGRALEGSGGKPPGDSADVPPAVVAGNGSGVAPADTHRRGPPSVPPPPSLHVANSRLVIVEKPTGSAAISLGFALDVTRGNPDFPALALAVSWLGEHRQFVGRLQNRMRSLRGLNYGNYAYTEFFRQDGGSVYPAAGCPRSQQYFSIWIRPVETSNGPFALREAVYELRRLLVEGIPEVDFGRIRDYVVGYSRLKEQTLDRRLGMAFDDRFYGLRDGADALRAAWSRLTREEVNDAIRRHWRASGLTMVMVVRDGEAVRRELLSGAPSTITYASPMPAAVREEDAVIGSLDLGLAPGQIRVLRASSLFEH